MKKVPRKIHQIYTKGWNALPDGIIASIEDLQKNNPGWEYHFYDEQRIIDFIQLHYGQAMLNTWLKINPEYGAARADFFRYLLIYIEGGVYLDVKSSSAKPFDNIIPDDCELLLCSWDNNACGFDNTKGRHDELCFLQNGEYQQWNITASPASPYIKAVIDEVAGRINHYKPWIYGIGRMGVLRTTGPIPFSIGIAKVPDSEGFYHIENYRDLGLLYTGVDKAALKKIKKSQYAQLKTPVVTLEGSDQKKYLLWLYLVFPWLRLKKNIINETRNVLVKLKKVMG